MHIELILRHNMHTKLLLIYKLHAEFIDLQVAYKSILMWKKHINNSWIANVVLSYIYVKIICISGMMQS